MHVHDCSSDVQAEPESFNDLHTPSCMRCKVEKVSEMRFLEDQHGPRLIVVGRDVPADSLQMGNVWVLAYESLTQDSDLSGKITEDPLLAPIVIPGHLECKARVDVHESLANPGSPSLPDKPAGHIPGNGKKFDLQRLGCGEKG